jgi:selenide, water dikinase
VSTTDFFPPLVDDPADYGAIAAANACSDVYAMGGRVVLAINVAAFPEHFPRPAMATIFDAAAAVVAEAGGTVAGGHTIRNPEPVFGLAVQGLVHPDRVFRKGGARPGDVLVLSKPLGTGLTLAGGEDADKAMAIAGMRTLNRRSSEVLQALGDAVHAVTDVTGYGLAGHGWEVADRSGVRLVIDSAGLVAYPGAAEAAERGVRTGGDARNRDYVAGHLDSTASATAEALVLDPQTSGGLLAAVDPAVAEALVADGFWRVGTIEAGEPAVVLR